MKRWIGVFVLAALVGGLLVACAPAVEVYSDPLVPIEAKVGQEFIIALDSNPTTGYMWYEDYDDSFLKLVEQKYERSLPGEGMVGAGGTESFEFQALKEGETEVTMVYKQGWEGGSVGQEYAFNVSIS
jgi:inhibitor of cysteine peptidase